MGIKYTSYIVLGYGFDEPEMIDYLDYKAHEEEIDTLSYMFSACGKHVVIGKILASSDKHDDKFYKMCFPDEEDYKEVEEKMIKSYKLNPGKPEIYFFTHGY